MKQALFLAFPLLSVLCVGLAACEDSTTGGGPVPPGGDAGIDPVPSTCAAPTAAPIAHETDVVTDETWGEGVHDVRFDVSVRKGATLTIAPCAVVRFDARRGMQIGFGNAEGGKLVAKGQADRPIVIEGRDKARWASLEVNPLGNADLAYVTIKDGGDRANQGALLHLRGDGSKPPQELATVDHVSLEGGLTYGAILESHAAFSAASHDLRIKDSGSTPMRVCGSCVSSIPTGQYTANTINAIRLWASAFVDIVDVDTTIHDRGVPYILGGEGQSPELSVQGAAVPLLTIEPGVVLKFSRDSSRNNGLFVERASGTTGARGALKAVGTPDKPVVFTSNESPPAAGDWIGLVFRAVPDPRNQIEFARVEYAGADTGTASFSCGTPPSPNPASNEAAIAIYGVPSSAFVKNTTITKSAANAFERGWNGQPVDFLPTNTLTDIAFCKQTFPRPTTGSCPDPAPCE